MSIGPKKTKLLKTLLKEIEEDVELLNRILDTPVLFSDNERAAFQAANNIRSRAEAIEGNLYSKKFKAHAIVDVTWDEETQGPKWYRDLGVLRVEDVDQANDPPSNE